MSVLTKGLAMDFERQGLKNMSITSIWPAVVSPCFPSSSSLMEKVFSSTKQPTD